MFFHKQKMFWQFRLKLGGLEVSRMTAPGIRSYMQIFSRFGLTWHRKVHFSTFDGKLEGSFMTKYLQIGFWISPEARGFWLIGLQWKSILKNAPPNKKRIGKLGRHHVSRKWLLSLCLFHIHCLALEIVD